VKYHCLKQACQMNSAGSCPCMAPTTISSESGAHQAINTGGVNNHSTAIDHEEIIKAACQSAAAPLEAWKRNSNEETCIAQFCFGVGWAMRRLDCQQELKIKHDDVRLRDKLIAELERELASWKHSYALLNERLEGSVSREMDELEEERDSLRTEVARLRDVCQMALDFYHLDTWQWTQKYGHGVTTKQLGDKFREALVKGTDHKTTGTGYHGCVRWPRGKAKERTK
jgi:hypothetical protein